MYQKLCWQLARVVGGVRVVSGAEKKNHLIEAAPFGRLDQMLSTIVSGGFWGDFALPAKSWGVWALGGSAPQPKPKKYENILKKFQGKKRFPGTLLTVPYFST